ncbi:Uncharacterised protein [Bordetella pertussis]|nr:Uncharacterised protein [Bordetella pertussis]
MNAISDLAEAPLATSKPTVSPESAARRVISGKASWIR